MGYYGNGFIFTQEPPWDAFAAALPASVALRGYRHKGNDIWALDAWKYSQREHWPFTDDFPEDVKLPLPLPAKSEETLAMFEAICDALPSSETPYGAGFLRACAQLSIIGRGPAFFFAADDELADMAVSASGGEFKTFRVRFGAGAVEFSNSQMVFVPFDITEDPECNATPEDLAALARVPGVTVGAVHLMDDGAPLYDSAVQLWPVGDPAQILGVGTWDPFQNVEREFVQVFERTPEGHASRVSRVSTPANTRQSAEVVAENMKPWWRFW